VRISKHKTIDHIAPLYDFLPLLETSSMKTSSQVFWYTPTTKLTNKDFTLRSCVANGPYNSPGRTDQSPQRAVSEWLFQNYWLLFLWEEENWTTEEFELSMFDGNPTPLVLHFLNPVLKAQHPSNTSPPPKIQPNLGCFLCYSYIVGAIVVFDTGENVAQNKSSPNCMCCLCAAPYQKNVEGI
jgi:hypothetical protein